MLARKFFTTLFSWLLRMKRVSTLLACLILSAVVVRAQDDATRQLRKLTQEAYRYYLSDPDTTLALTQQALSIARETGDMYHEGYSYYLFSKAFWVKTNYKLSTEYGFKALRIFQELGHHQELAQCQISLARTLVELGNYRKARDLIQEALQYGLDHADLRIQASAYREQSFLQAELNHPDSTLYFSDKGLALLQMVDDSLDISVLYGRKSRIFFQQKRFKESRDYAYRALLIDSLVNNRRGLGISYFQVAQNEHALGNRKKAIKQLLQSIRINREIGNLSWQVRAHDLLAALYLENKEPEKAAIELQKVSQYKDDLYNSEKNGQIQEMQSLHELEAKEKTIQLLEQDYELKQQQVNTQRLFVGFLLITVLFLVLLVFVLTRLRNVQLRTNQNLASKNFAIEQQKLAIQLQAEDLRRLDKIKTKLFSVISHDLRGPISNLQALLDMFTQKLMTADEFVALSGKLKENLNLTQRALENLLSWSLSQMGGIKTERKRIEITESLDEASRLMEEAALRKNITFKKEFSRPMSVWADANQLQVILRNLIHNAIKFSAFDSQIDITAVRENNVCQITIKDYGIGMSDEEIETLVGSNKYFSKIGTEQEKGTGLGLLLCKEFITRNGGEICIRSGLGEGTEVSFTLMLAEPALEMVPQ